MDERKLYAILMVIASFRGKKNGARELRTPLKVLSQKYF